MRSTSRRCALLLLFAAGIVLQTDQVSARKAVTCGAYTDRLCEAQSLMASEYLESPNGDYKFYYQADGHALIYYVRTDPWTVIESFHSGAFATPQELTYTDPWVNWTYGSTYGSVHITVWSTDGEDDYLDGLYYDTSVTPDGDHFLVLDNDGSNRDVPFVALAPYDWPTSTLTGCEPSFSNQRTPSATRSKSRRHSDNDGTGTSTVI